MFNNLKQMAGLAGIMKDLPRIKAKLADVKARLEDLRVSAESGGGAVKAIVTGKLRVVSIHINRDVMASLIDPADTDGRLTTEGVIAQAVNEALEKSQQRAAREFADAAEELGLPIPPGGLAGLL